MTEQVMKELLEAGAHFGHHRSAWNPKAKPFVYQERSKMHIINLRETVKGLERACEFVRKLGEEGKKIVFVGTKHQAQKTIEEEAQKCGAYWVNTRWLGGFLTNFSTMKKSLERFKQLEQIEEEEFPQIRTKKEKAHLKRELEKLRRNFKGIKAIESLPDALYVVDVKVEETAVKEAKRMGVPVVAIVDTNVDPEPIDYPIPANDDAIKTIKLITSKIANAYLEGKKLQEESEKLEAKKESEAEKELLEESLEQEEEKS